MSKLKHQQKRIKDHRRAVKAIIVLCLAIMIVAIWQLFQVQRIEVIGLTHVSEASILEWVDEGIHPSNSLYLFWRHNNTEVTLPPGVEDIEFNMYRPWAVQFRVHEKRIVAGILHEGNFVYFDQDGMVLLVTDEFKDDVPLIKGLDVSYADLHRVLPAADRDIFRSILETTQMLPRYDLYPDRIVCEGRDINLYFGYIRVQLGHENLPERIIQIPPILDELDEERGILHLERFNSTTRNISFIPDN